MTPVVPYHIRKSEDGARESCFYALRTKEWDTWSSCRWIRHGY